MTSAAVAGIIEIANRVQTEPLYGRRAKRLTRSSRPRVRIGLEPTRELQRMRSFDGMDNVDQDGSGACLFGNRNPRRVSR